MRKSYKIALSGICTALSAIFLMLAFFFQMASISFYILASLVLLLPLSKKMYGYAALVAIASALFSLLLGWGWIGLFIPYVLFFGIHPILTVGLKDIKKLNKFIAMPIKQIFFNGAFCLIYLIIKETFFPFIDTLIERGWLWLIIIILNIIFFIYDQLFLVFAKRAEYYVSKFTKSD